ncbi:sialate O-acetylesterase [Cohnella zeiphila]|uniref:Sialate O-acetylesterase domain-containing protein n=1 Tax=Cohnella zeiphila TaxID=2761120 RepID=A0A7X0SLG7_9BACL|nr:sialate O-acetylesterase [Cohnella zeiphila]MBB6732200.1 hypothetical protein [Cohnella zeiphila]
MTASFALAPLFTDGMVLQRQKPVTIWGNGPEGARVTVEIHGQSASAVVSGGRWSVLLEPLPEGGPYELTAKCRDGSDARRNADLRFADVLVGEVWLAGGQSNMVQPLLVAQGGVETAALLANRPGIRFFTVPRRPFPDARVPGWDFIGTFSVDANWLVCDPETALRFSAIGAHFAELLRLALDGVPVGIVSCNWGGTPAEAWMGERHLAGDPLLKPLLDEYRERIAGLDLEVYEREHDRYIRDMFRLIEERGDIERRVKELGLQGYRDWIADHPLIWPDQPFGPKHPERPCGLYHTMLETVAPYAIRGVLWYQGESNAHPGKAPLYRHLLVALIGAWREAWQDPDLPFLIVQLAGFAPADAPHGDAWSLVREAQSDVAREVPHVSLVVTLDCGEQRDIHPIDKRTVAERLALAARADVYGQPVRASGPAWLGPAFEGDTARLGFDPGGEPPAESDDPLAGFEICGDDRRFVPAEARFREGAVQVRSPEVGRPVAVRYAWGNWPAYSIFGRNGIPAPPFRTDRYGLQ